MGEKVVIWRLDNGPAHAQGRFSCSLCEWVGTYGRSAQRHAKKVHGGKATLKRKNPPNFKLSEEAREANRQSLKRWRDRQKVRVSHNGRSPFALLGSMDADHAASCSTGYSRE